MNHTSTFKVEVRSTFHNGCVVHTTYISASNEAEARKKLDREGLEVLSIRVVQLTHLGGEVA